MHPVKAAAYGTLIASATAAVWPAVDGEPLPLLAPPSRHVHRWVTTMV
jgi:hypothetical protein